MAANKALIEANWARAMNEVYWPKPAPTILPKGLPGFYAFIADHIGRDVPLDYLEFGVAQGNSMRLISSVFTSPYARFYGFDSFMGLPERWQMHDVGAFSNKGNPPRIDDERVSFVKGWFQNSVPPFLDVYRYSRGRPVLVHIDADLYSATLFLLASLWAHIEEYFFIFDDFIFDEVVALRDFATAFPVEFRFFAQTKGGGQRPNPDQVFGHMKRVPFELKPD